MLWDRVRECVRILVIRLEFGLSGKKWALSETMKLVMGTYCSSGSVLKFKFGLKAKRGCSGVW